MKLENIETSLGLVRSGYQGVLFSGKDFQALFDDLKFLYNKTGANHVSVAYFNGIYFTFRAFQSFLQFWGEMHVLIPFYTCLISFEKLKKESECFSHLTHSMVGPRQVKKQMGGKCTFDVTFQSKNCKSAILTATQFHLGGAWSNFHGIWVSNEVNPEGN